MKHGIVWSCSLFATVAFLVLVGCGSGDPRLYERSGYVDWKGEAVPSGSIVFEPDAAQGNKGPLCRAIIDDGYFRTLPGQGAVAGPVIVRIEGYGGKSLTGEPGDLPLLFPVYETKDDLPASNSEHDYEVPVTNAK